MFTILIILRTFWIISPKQKFGYTKLGLLDLSRRNYLSLIYIHLRCYCVFCFVLFCFLFLLYLLDWFRFGVIFNFGVTFFYLSKRSFAFNLPNIISRFYILFWLNSVKDLESVNFCSCGKNLLKWMLSLCF